MRLEVGVDERARRLTYVVQGTIDFAAVAAQVGEHPPEFDWSWSILWDVREVEGQYEPPDVRPLREVLAQRWPADVEHGRTALLARRNLEYGVGRMFEAIAEPLPRQVRVFREEAQALAWLAGGRAEADRLACT